MKLGPRQKICSSCQSSIHRYTFQIIKRSVYQEKRFYTDWVQSVQFSRSVMFGHDCDPMNCSTPGPPVHHQLPESTRPMSIESVMPSNHLIFHCPLLLPPIPPSIRVFQMSQLFASGGQSTGISASTSVLPMDTQD